MQRCLCRIPESVSSGLRRSDFSRWCSDASTACRSTFDLTVSALWVSKEPACLRQKAECFFELPLHSVLHGGQVGPLALVSRAGSRWRFLEDTCSVT